MKAGVRRTLEGEAVARRRYQEMGLSLDNGGCVGDQHLVVEWCLVFLCILQCCMAIGRLQVAFIDARLGDLAKDNAVAVQGVLYRASPGARLGVSVSPNGEEARALFLAWEEFGPRLAYALEDGEWQAVVATRNLLQGLYSDTPPRSNLRATNVVRAYRLHCCKAACQSNYLFYLEEDVTLAVAAAADLGVGLGAVCANVVESLNAILKQAYNDHTARGGCRGQRHYNGRGRWFCRHGNGGFYDLTFHCDTTGRRIAPGAPWPNSWPPQSLHTAHLLLATRWSCFTTTWTEKCGSPSLRTC